MSIERIHDIHGNLFRDMVEQQIVQLGLPLELILMDFQISDASQWVNIKCHVTDGDCELVATFEGKSFRHFKVPQWKIWLTNIYSEGN